MSIDQTIERVRSFVRFKRWSNARLAREAGLHENTLRGLDAAGWSPRADTLRKLETVIPDEFEAG